MTPPHLDERAARAVSRSRAVTAAGLCKKAPVEKRAKGGVA
jgi:hypothetical protein